MLRCGGESGRAAVEISLKHLDQCRFDRDPAVLAALAANMYDGPVVGASEVTDAGTQHFIGTQPGHEPGEDECAVAFYPFAAPPRFRF